MKTLYPLTMILGLTLSALDAAEPPELPLEMRVPFEPTTFPSAGKAYCTYELYMTNFGSKPMALRRIDVLDAESSGAPPVAILEGGLLNSSLHRIGDEFLGGRIPLADDDSRRALAPGQTLLVFVSIAIDPGKHVPKRLRHRVLTSESSIEGAMIGTQGTPLRVLGAPVRGTNWLASSGPSNDSHHRRGVLVFEGHAVVSRRYAIDWLQVENGAMFAGDESDNRSYYAYDEPLLAVSDGKVVNTRNGLPDNMPRKPPMIEITTDTAAGNFVTIDLGSGLFAHYMHVQPGSIGVKQGDRVRRGQVLARIGASGDARAPHVHFEITTSPKILAGEGVPYLIDRYHVTSVHSQRHKHERELPLRDMMVDF